MIPQLGASYAFDTDIAVHGLVGIILIFSLVVFVGFFIYKLFIDPNGLLPLMCIGLLLGLLFLFWMMLPNFIRSPIRWLFKRKGHKK